MRYGSVCSGIEAATVAWYPLGWEPAFFSEIEKFPRAVLKHHYPEVPLHGDFTTIKGDEYGAIELLCGGTPCQSFSIAGQRKGLDDARGNLSLEFIRLALRSNARWVVWENVPGVLSSEGGEDFAALISAFTGHDYAPPRNGWRNAGIIQGRADRYGIAYRVLDAQYFGVPQRRRRVVLVGYIGDWRPAAAVLFERESLRGDITPRRKTREEIAGTLGARTCRSIGAQDAEVGHLIPDTTGAITAGAFTGGAGGRPEGAAAGHFFPAVYTKQAIGEYAQLDVASTVSARDHKDATDLVSISLGHTKSNGSGVNESGQAYTLEATATCGQAVAAPIGFPARMSGTQCAASVDVSPSLGAANPMAVAHIPQGFAFDGLASNSMKSGNPHSGCHPAEIAKTVDATRPDPSKNQGGNAILHGMAVRRLTPRECERLQGFPDDYTRIPWRGKPAQECPDGNRYKAVGNSWAVPKFSWLGERIKMVDEIVRGMR